jgi:hypothetical protein
LFKKYKKALGDVANEEDTFGDDKYNEEIDTVDLKEALGKINSSVVVNYPSLLHYHVGTVLIDINIEY